MASKNALRVVLDGGLNGVPSAVLGNRLGQHNVLASIQTCTGLLHMQRIGVKIAITSTFGSAMTLVKSLVSASGRNLLCRLPVRPVQIAQVDGPGSMRDRHAGRDLLASR